MRKQTLRIADLVYESEYYPRMKTSWLTAYQYAMAMKSGCVFPRITVGNFKGKFYVVDGWHRIEALKLLGEEYVEATVKNYSSEAEMFADAVRLNTTHGRQLSVQEKARIIDKLKSYNFSLEQISEIVKVPVDKIERFTFKVVVAPNGSKVYLKSIVEKLGEKEVVGVEQERFNVRNVQNLLNQLLDLLRNGLFPFEDGAVRELAVEVYSLLREGLKLEAK